MAIRRIHPGVLHLEQRVGVAPRPPRWLSLAHAQLPLVGAGRVYVCGITPYDVTHLGHAATFVWADVLGSVLDATGVAPRVCRNVTDVDDVLFDAARDRGRYADELALGQEAAFDQTMRALRVAVPQDSPRARHHVDDVVQLAQALLDRGAAYVREGTVWFRGHDVPVTAGVDPAAARALAEAYGDRPGDPAKDDPFDVAVWQPSDEGRPAWPSPWGWGRPGWHAECAAMALAVHGASVDVLVGGDDLVFPHHAYQAAMVEAATGVTPFARAHVHVGEVRLAGAKMAKSTGNLVLVDDLLQGTEPAVLRLLLLHRPHGEPWSFESADLDGARAMLEDLYAAAARPSPDRRPATDPAHDRVLACLLDDLDVVGAVRVALDEGGETARRLIGLLRLG